VFDVVPAAVTARYCRSLSAAAAAAVEMGWTSENAVDSSFACVSRDAVVGWFVLRSTVSAASSVAAGWLP